MSVGLFRIYYVTAILWTVALRCITAEVVRNSMVTKDERTMGIEDWVRENPRPTGEEPEVAMAALATGRIFIVDKSGAPGHYVSVQGAVDDVPKGNTQRIIIQIGAGMFHEKVTVPVSKPFITFQGAGKEFTTIAWGDTVQKAGSVANSATVGVDAEGFIASGVTIQNTAPVSSPAGAEDEQAVALRISADQAAFYDCNIIGAQDTVYDDHGRHYFENCFIQGPVKFICGNGQSLYKGCQLQANARGAATVKQRRMSSTQERGFSFVDCSATGSSVLYLGRIWGPYSRVVFAYSYVEKTNMQPKSWFNWRIWNRYKYDSNAFVYIT